LNPGANPRFPNARNGRADESKHRQFLEKEGELKREHSAVKGTDVRRIVWRKPPPTM
jgi:hypothetical protein